MMALRLVVCVWMCCWMQWGWATTVAIPDPLKPWKEWVLQGEENLACPFYFQDFKSRQCVWPGRLSLTVEATELQFSQEWQLFSEADVALPGSDGYWPRDVEVNGAAAPVLDNKGTPQLHLAAGRYQINGTIAFQTLPDSIVIPPQTALLKLWQNGVLKPRPQRDADGRLWLVDRQQPQITETKQLNTEDKLSLRVFRRLTDDIPFRVETLVELEVGGKAREMLLGKILFDQFIPEDFVSPLPARIETDGRLRLQLRPGQWSIRLVAHRLGPLDKLFFETAGEGFWPEEEVWVVESQPHLRQIRVEGSESIDPNQTTLPDDWKSFPAYRLQAGEAMQLVELRRGDPQPSPNQLNLERTLWLDFDGAGITSEDRINGYLYRDWRLVANPELALGSLELNGQPQVITTLNDTAGVEVRQGQLNAVALSRITADSVHHYTLSSTGWQHDVDQLSARIQLPPGWRVFTVAGADSAYNTWTGSWSVWDIFIVLIAIVAVIRLRGMAAGIVCAFALLLIYPEAPTFLYLWLNVIAVMAVLFLLPEGKLRRVCNFYGTFAALALALWLLSFMVTQARLGLYPQLYQPWKQMGSEDSYSYQEEYAVPAAPEAESGMMSVATDMASSKRSLELSAPARTVKQKAEPKIERMDPNLAAQTGPGRPNWEWVQTTLRWSGPVTQGESFDLYLLTPWENRILAWLRVLLGVLMLVSVVGIKKINGQWKITPWRTRVVQPALLLCVLTLGLATTSPDARADIPDQALLQELKQRLLTEKDCTPSCVGIERLHIDISGQRLNLRFTVHTRESVYWPLPASQQQWQPDAVLLNGETYFLSRKSGAADTLQVQLPAGQNDLQVTGFIGQGEFQLTFPVQPHNVTLQVPGWTVRGVENGRLLANGIYFEPALVDQKTPDEPQTQKQLQPDPVPPFVHVRRELRLGLNWYLETRVERIAPRLGGITLEIPLLPGESVTSQVIEVKNGKAKVNIKPGQKQVSWFSALDKTTLLTLVADTSGRWSESWIVDPSPLWHLDSEGIAPVKETGVVSQWKPRWYPYPGEQLTLHIQRPEAIDGATTTVDQVQQTVTPGQRETQHQLRLHVISSKGSEQRVDLPLGSCITQVRVDNESRAVDEASQRVIVPINPGQHWIDVEWRQTEDLATRVITPLVNVNAPYVNHSIQVQVPAGRWVLFAGGPQMGPAILFWGVLIVTLIVAFGLGRMKQLPVKTWHWILLVLGLCAGWIQLLVPLVVWFVAMQRRSQLNPQRLNRAQFNLLQLGLAVLSVVTFVALLAAIPNGLLGSPDMGVVGNGSSQYQLNWFVDRGTNELQQAWFISIPLWVYRGLMLVWSLWLALKLLNWLKWGWQAFTHEGYWRSDKIKTPQQMEKSE